MLRALTGLFAAIFRKANSEQRSDRVVWVELPEALPDRGRDWTSFPAHHLGVRLLESDGDRVEEEWAPGVDSGLFQKAKAG